MSPVCFVKHLPGMLRLAASFAAKYGIFGIKAVDLQELPFTSEIAFRL
jgi:hypothetical protein